MRPVKSTMPRGLPCGRHASPLGPADRSVTRPNAGPPLTGFAAAEDDAFAGGVLFCVFLPVPARRQASVEHRARPPLLALPPQPPHDIGAARHGGDTTTSPADEDLTPCCCVSIFGLRVQQPFKPTKHLVTIPENWYFLRYGICGEIAGKQRIPDFRYSRLPRFSPTFATRRKCARAARRGRRRPTSSFMRMPLPRRRCARCTTQARPRATTVAVLWRMGSRDEIGIADRPTSRQLASRHWRC
jgi:hypothetical protein